MFSGVSSISITCPLGVFVTLLFGYKAAYGTAGSPVTESGVLLSCIVVNLVPL